MSLGSSRAPECRSWIWCSRSKTFRSKFKPWGDSTKNFVYLANIMVFNLSVLLLVAHIRGVAIFVEQPSSSLLRSYEPFKTFWEYALRHTARTYLGAFGAKTPKPIDIMSNCSDVHKLRRPPPQGLDRLCSKDSKGGVNGKKSMMSSSQSYPSGFGRAVSKVYKNMLKKKCVRKHFSMLHAELFHL